MHNNSQRVLAMLARLCDHLSTSTLPPPRPETSWTAERDSLAKEHLEGAAEQRVRATIEPQLLEVMERVKRAVGAKFASAGDG